MWKKYKSFIISIAAALAVGGLSALITRNNMDLFSEVQKPPLSPPGVLFPIVWTLLYILMGFSSAIIYEHREFKKTEAEKGLILYGVNLFVNFLWSIIFFNFNAFMLSFIWLLILLAVIISMTAEFYKVNKLAAYLQIPYIIWVTFAGYLTAGIAILN